jgi:hypothetical protein
LRAFTNHETTCSTLSPEAQGCSSCRQRPTGRVARLVPHAAHRTRGCHTAGWQVLTCARSQLGFDAAIRIRVVVVCRNPRLEQHRGGRRVVVWWTRGLAVCAWLGSLFSVEGAVQKEAVVDTVMSQRGGLRCAQRSWRAQVLPAGQCRGCCILAWPNSGWGRERTRGCRHCATRGHGCCVVCRCVRGPFLRQPHQKGPPGAGPFL